jgi:HK97 family phage major capsid protein
MQLARQIPMGDNGTAIPVFTSGVAASWVSETNAKPTAATTPSVVNMVPKKLAVIVPISSEVYDRAGAMVINEVENEIATAFATAFDNALLRGTSSPFAAFISQTTKQVQLNGTATYTELMAAYTALVNDNKYLDDAAFALDPRAVAVLLGAVDTIGRPLFLPGTTDTVLGLPAVTNRHVFNSAAPHEIAYFGDWSRVVWGTSGGIQYDVSNEATVGGVSAFESNLVYIRAEAYYGAIVQDAQAFVKMTQDVPA